MKKRIWIVTLTAAVFSVMVFGCGKGTNDILRGISSERIHAEELTADAGMAVNPDYAKPSREPLRQFSYELLKNHLDDSNPVLSPVSAYVALCMLANGAQGQTKEELLHVLGDDIMCLPDDLMNNLPQDEKSLQLTMADSVWVDHDFIPENEWLGTLKSLFDASVYRADLDTDTTKNDINLWVGRNTNQMITNLLEKNLDSNTRLVLLNALYFKADWKNPFDAQNTNDSMFYLDDGSQKEVSMMYQLCYDCEYLEDGSSRGIVFPYADSSYAFVAVMPEEGETIREWYNGYSAEKLHALISGRKKKNLELGLVKFTAGCRQNLNRSLMDMGVIRMFDPDQADLSLAGRTKDGNHLFVSRVFQEAVIKVAEEGTEASAATMIDMSDGGAMISDEVLILDRPFFYMIMDMDQEIPVFMGIMDQPEA